MKKAYIIKFRDSGDDSGFLLDTLRATPRACWKYFNTRYQDHHIGKSIDKPQDRDKELFKCVRIFLSLSDCVQKIKGRQFGNRPDLIVMDDPVEPPEKIVQPKLDGTCKPLPEIEDETKKRR